MEENEVTDEELRLLLRRAEERMKVVRPAGEAVDDAPSQESPSTSVMNGSIPKYALPSLHLRHSADIQNFTRLKTGVIDQPYITSRHGLARADPGRLLDNHTRRLSDQSKRVENPVNAREQIIKVCCAYNTTLPSTSMRKIFPIVLTLRIWSRLGQALHS